MNAAYPITKSATAPRKKGSNTNKTIAILIIFLFLHPNCLSHSIIPETSKSATAPTPVLKDWVDGESKERITKFIRDVTTEGSPNFVPIENRRAFFDLDGTLITERPDYTEVLVARARLLEKVRSNPSLANEPIYSAVLNNDEKYLQANVKSVIAEAFQGETLENYISYSRNFLAVQKHPKFNIPYIKMLYSPMIELIKYMKFHGFSIYVVSTSQQEFMQSLGLETIGVPPQNMVGTVVGFKVSNLDQSAPHSFVRTRNYYEPYNSDDGKVIRLRERVLLPAIFAFGNSMGDYAMLDSVADSGLPNLVCILDHDDPEREYEYHKKDLLQSAQERKWLIVRMKHDFRTIFKQTE